MSFLQRLKNVFSGEDDSENKDKSVKSETEKPPVDEKETKDQATSKEASEKTEAEKSAKKTKDAKPGEKKSQPVEEKPATKEEPEEPPVLKESTQKETTVTKTESKEEKPEKAEEKVEEKPVESEKKPQKERSENMTLLQSDENLITRADVDVDFKQSIMDAGAESVAVCFQCGTCTGACPSGRRTPYRIRGVVRRAVMGLKEDVISDDTIWMCTTCYECQERCPRGIKIVDIVKIIRNQAAQAGFMAPAHKMTGLFVTKTGHGVPINDATMALRKSVGLDELPPTTHQFPEALEEVQKIVKATGFDELIGYNWETGELE